MINNISSSTTKSNFKNLEVDKSYNSLLKKQHNQNKSSSRYKEKGLKIKVKKNLAGKKEGKNNSSTMEVDDTLDNSDKNTNEKKENDVNKDINLDQM